MWAAAALTVGVLASCTTAPTPEPVAPTQSADNACFQVSDVGTLVFNMKQAWDAGRIPGEEYQGAMYLAGSMLGRIGESDDDEVNGDVLALRDAAGTYAVDPDSAEWKAAFAAVSESCTAVLGEFGVSGWVGG
ncbi:MAG: hypothetical protein ABI566_03580 [Pseudolysinimonas sp.]